jgi:glycoprotein 3-alpha-L-fucosyltransferase
MRRSIRLKRLIIILLIILIIVGIFQLIKIRSDNNRFKELVYINGVNYNYSNQISIDVNVLKTIYTNNVNMNDIKTDIKTIQANRRSSKKDNYLIIEYTKIFFLEKFCKFSSNQIFNSPIEKCKYQNCNYTCNKIDYLKQADALIFHQRDLEVEFKDSFNYNLTKWLENTKQLPFKTVEEKLNNNPKQIWILWNDENTPIDIKFNEISNLFNWTLTFKTDSEIYEGSYGYFIKNSNINSLLFKNIKENLYFNDYKQRKNAILWFVSNCNPKYMFRVNKAIELSKYYPIYIYGKCEPLNNINKQLYPNLNYIQLNNKECGRGSKCEEDKLKSFKYYLAFENINCKDYITEKIWRSLEYNIIPIILQPNRDSYERHKIPIKSIIHLNDFKTIYNLANYLNEIDNNFNIYFDHLKWTNIYLKSISNPKYTEPHRMCQLCTKLNTLTSNIYYNKIADFFNKDCLI